MLDTRIDAARAWCATGGTSAITAVGALVLLLFAAACTTQLPHAELAHYRAASVRISKPAPRDPGGPQGPMRCSIHATCI